MSVVLQRAGAVLRIDVGAVVANWRLLGAAAGGTSCAAVVKADAYGLGAVPVCSALEAAGCSAFFVAHLDEGLHLRRHLRAGSRIGILNGTPPGTERDFVDASLTPVVNTMGELAAWRAHAGAMGRRLPVILQLDTGMSRLGLSPVDVEVLAADPALLHGLSVELVMSHLACADEPSHPANHAQRERFEALRALLPPAPASLANSSGIFLGGDFRCDLVRAGAALYGVNPTPGAANPMRPVVTLSARVLQTRDVDPGRGIGYGHRSIAPRRLRLATLALGYADGWPRNADTFAVFRGQRMPFAGRVSMDSLVVDATDCANPPLEGDMVELIGPEQTVDDVAHAAGTIGYEILTRLGTRFDRIYLDAPPGSGTR